MKHIMLDLETLGNNSQSTIVSISAVQFCIVSGNTNREFHTGVNFDSSVKAGMLPNQSTLLWWFRQNKDAIDDSIIESLEHGLPLHESLNLFGKFVDKVRGDTEEGDIRIWGNGISFDIGLLKRAYEILEIEMPWMFWEERDLRTLVDFAPSVKRDEPFVGIPHYGIDDCKHQVKYATKIMQQIV